MIRGFIAASVDGCVADTDGGADWLKPFEGVDYGYERFFSEIGTVVLGRKTYDQIPSFGMGWPYPGGAAWSSPRVRRRRSTKTWNSGPTACRP